MNFSSKFTYSWQIGTKPVDNSHKLGDDEGRCPKKRRRLFGGGGLTKRVAAAKESAETPISLGRRTTEIGGNGFSALGEL